MRAEPSLQQGGFFILFFFQNVWWVIFFVVALLHNLKTSNMKKEKVLSKELQQIEDALIAYYEKHHSDVVINVCVCAFDEESDVVDDYLWLMGGKDLLVVNNECMLDEINNLVE